MIIIFFKKSIISNLSFTLFTFSGGSSGSSGGSLFGSLTSSLFMCLSFLFTF
jgi:hypothetical protein